MQDRFMELELKNGVIQLHMVRRNKRKKNEKCFVSVSVIVVSFRVMMLVDWFII